MKYYVVDAFAEHLFTGNPAGVCLLESELSEEIMQKIAFENNLAETAFLLKKENIYYLRWFTPEVEINLCGHATLATAFIMMNYVLPDMTIIKFQTKSGELIVTKDKDVYTLDFPSTPAVITKTPELLEEALGCKVLETYSSRDMVVVVEDENTIRNLNINMEVLKAICKDIAFAIIVTAKGDQCDFVSRFFAPNAGILEDPVTGSSHCTLIPFWSKRIQKNIMSAEQLSKRGGKLHCEYLGERVKIGGKAVCYLEGELRV